MEHSFAVPLINSYKQPSVISSSPQLKQITFEGTVNFGILQSPQITFEGTVVYQNLQPQMSEMTEFLANQELNW